MKIFYAMILGLGLVGCAKHQEPKSTAQLEKKELSRPVPNGWTEIKHKNSSYLIPSLLERSDDKEEVYISPDKTFETVYLIEVTNLSLEDYIQSNLDTMPEGVVLEKKKEKKIGNNKTYLSILTVDKEVYVAQLTTKIGDTIYNLACGGPLEFAKMTAGICTQILSSLEFKQ